MSDILDKIVASTRARLLPPETPHAFAAAISRPGINVIAEIKSASPSAGTIVDNPDVEAIARDYKRGGAAAVSIVTEPEFFHGSSSWIARARRSSGLPAIMKDFIVDDRQLLHGIAAGANAILLLASCLTAQQLKSSIALLDQFGCDALVEVHDEAELERAIEGGAKLIGVNNRNLRDFSVDLATSERLSKLMPPGTIKVAESGIKTRQDVDRLRNAGFHAFLVGESLLRQEDRAAAVRALTQLPSPPPRGGEGAAGG